ncbi:MAG: hypothetical protein AB7I08_11025 [Thermoleophilia bacterium]
MALGYTIVGILLGGAVILAVGICLGLWFGVSASRPELMERRPPTVGPDEV